MSEVEDSDWLINRQHHLEKWFIDSHHISVCISSEFNNDNEHHQVDCGGLDADSSSSPESVDEVKQSESICSFVFFFRLHLVLVIWVSQCGILYLLLLDSIQEEENSELHHWTTRTCRDDRGETEREAVLTNLLYITVIITWLIWFDVGSWTRSFELHFVVSPHQLDSCPEYEDVSDFTAAQTEDTEQQEDMLWSPVRLETPASNKTSRL